MKRRLTTTWLTGIAVGLAVLVPVASAGSQPTKVEVPAWLAKIQYPGTSSQPTVYMAGGVVIPAALARIQYPGASSEPTVYVAAPTSTRTVARPVPGQIAIPAWLAKIQYPGTSSQPTVYTSLPAGHVTDTNGFDWGSFGIGIAAACGLALILAGAAMALRRRRPLAHA